MVFLFACQLCSKRCHLVSCKEGLWSSNIAPSKEFHTIARHLGTRIYLVYGGRVATLVHRHVIEPALNPRQSYGLRQPQRSALLPAHNQRPTKRDHQKNHRSTVHEPSQHRDLPRAKYLAPYSFASNTRIAAGFPPSCRTATNNRLSSGTNRLVRAPFTVSTWAILL